MKARLPRMVVLRWLALVGASLGALAADGAGATDKLAGRAYVLSGTERFPHVLAQPTGPGRFIKVHRFEDPATDVNLATDIPEFLRPLGVLENLHHSLPQRATAFFVSECHVFTNVHAVTTKAEMDYYVKSNLKASPDIAAKFVAGVIAKAVGADRDRRLRFKISRRPDGRFDQGKTNEVVEITYFNPELDQAVLRLRDCDGAKHGVVNIFNEAEVAGFSYLHRKDEKMAVFVAGYAGDREEHVLSFTACEGAVRKSYTIFHKCNTLVGQSGGPLFALSRTTDAGTSRYLTRDQKYDRAAVRGSRMTFFALHNGDTGGNDPTANTASIVKDHDRIRQLIDEDLRKPEVIDSIRKHRP